jgi:uncharacterized protein YndB with AHSA1/START domain
MSADTSHLIRISYRFDASPERVFDAWLVPEKVAAWMAAPARAMTGTTDEILHIEVDARVGGRFSFKVRRQGQAIDHVGEYLELDRPRRLVFTWGVAGFDGSSTVSMDFTPDGAGTLVSLTCSGVTPEYQERTEKGWTTILGAIAATL